MLSGALRVGKFCFWYVMIPSERAAASSQLWEYVFTFFPITTAVPVSWQVGRTPSAAVMEFFVKVAQNDVITGFGII